MINETFAYGKSFLHRLDPRGKVIAALVFCSVIAITDRTIPLLVGLGYAFILVLLARLSWQALLKRLLIFNIFIVFVWILVLTSPGETLYVIGPITISRTGVKIASSITLKANVIFLITVALITTIPMVSLGHALRQIGLPAKFIHLFTFTYRYMHVLEKEFDNLLRAALIRGFRPRTTMHTYRTFAYIIGMLLLRSINRAERIHEAMLCRGFCGKFYSLTHFVLSPYDFVFISVSGAFISTVWWTGWMLI